MATAAQDWLASLDNEELAQLFYFAYYGRPADVTGLQFWVGGIDQYGSLQAVSDVFAASEEAQEVYGGLSTLDAVSKLYGQMFNRVPEASGLDYWVDAIDNGVITLADLPLMLCQGAQGSDLEILQNKLAAATALTDAMKGSAEAQLAYQGTGATEVALDWLQTVGDDASLAAALAQIPDVLVAVERFQPGEHFILTTGIDESPEYDGTNGADEYKANDDTLTAFDSLDGREGYDRLEISSYGGLGDVAIDVDVTSIENVLIRSVGDVGYFDMSNWTGVEQLNAVVRDAGMSDSGSIAIASSASELVNIDADGQVFSSDMTAPVFDILVGEDVTVYAGNVESMSIVDKDGDDWSSENMTILTADTEALDLTIENITNGYYGDTTTIGGFGTAEGPTTLNLTANGASDGLDFTSNSDLQTINVTAAGEADYLWVDARALQDTLSMFDASEFGGTVDFWGAVNSDNTTLTVLTNAGSDSIWVSDDGSTTTDVTVNAGEGDNYVGLDVHGVIDVTTGAGDDELETNVVALDTAGSSAALGGGDNTLSVHFEKTASDSDINSLGNEPVTGNIGTFNIWDDVRLSDAATLDLSAFDGEVHTIGFTDVEPAEGASAENPQLTILGAAPELMIESWDDFGLSGASDAPSGQIDLVVEDVESLTIDAGHMIGIHLHGAAEAAVAASEQTQMAELTDITLLAGDSIELDIEDFRNSATIYADADAPNGGWGWAEINVSYSTLGDITALGGEDRGSSWVNIAGTTSDEVSVGNVVAAAASDDDNNGDAWGWVSVYDNDDSLVTVGNVDVTAEQEAAVWVSDNDGSEVALGDVTVTSLEASYYSSQDGYSTSYTLLGISDNDASTVDVGTVDVNGYYAGALINDNDTGAEVTVGNITVDGDYYAGGEIDWNWNSAIATGDLSFTASSGFAGFQITRNSAMSDDASVEVGNVTIDGYYTAGFGVYGNSDNTPEGNLTIDVGDVSVDSEYYAFAEILNNSDTDITIGTLDIGSTVSATAVLGSDDGTDFAGLSIYGNSDGGSIDVGDTSVSANYYASVFIDVSDTEVSLDNLTVASGEDAYVWMDGDDGPGNDGSLGLKDVSVTAGDNMTVWISDVTMGDLTLDMTGAYYDDNSGDSGMVYLSDVDGLEVLTASGSSDASLGIELDYVWDLESIDLTGMASDSDTTINAANGDYADGLLVKIGNGNLTFYGEDTGSISSSDHGVAEVFEFVGSTVGTIRIGENGNEYNVLEDSIDLTSFDFNINEVNVTYTGDNSTGHYVITFDDPDLGSISLDGLSRDEVQALVGVADPDVAVMNTIVY